MTNFIEQLLELAIHIQQISAPTFEEKGRAEFVRERFIQEGLEDVSMDSVNNLYGRWVGGGGPKQNAKPLIVSAHMDTVFPSGTNLNVTRDDERIYGPGLGDNSLGVAALVWINMDAARAKDSITK